MIRAIHHLKVTTKLLMLYILSLLGVVIVLVIAAPGGNPRTNFLLAAGLSLAAIAIMWALIRLWLARPFDQILNVGKRLSKGDLTAKVSLKSGDELQQLGDTFNSLASDLAQALNRQEITVAERTMILQRRARQLQAAAEVGKAAVTFRNLDILLPEVVRLISTRFDLYHVGIFLLDPSREYAVLRAASSEGGKQLIRDEHKLKVGAQGMVGFVATTGEPRIALDVGQDAVHFKNPALPDTRSEMALPLSIGGKILGVLDVQSTRPSAFTDEDASILQIMADQVAIAIDNAHLLAEANESLATSRRAYGELRQEVWKKVLSGKPDVGYIATREDDIAHLSALPAHSEISIAIESGTIVQTESKVVAIPIKLRDQVIGAVRLQKSERERNWSPEEIKLMQSIADQLSITLESARLYEDTQRRAERERLASDITAKIRASNDPGVILQVAARELRQALHASHAQVLVRASDRESLDQPSLGQSQPVTPVTHQGP